MAVGGVPSAAVSTASARIVSTSRIGSSTTAHLYKNILDHDGFPDCLWPWFGPFAFNLGYGYATLVVPALVGRRFHRHW